MISEAQLRYEHGDEEAERLVEDLREAMCVAALDARRVRRPMDEAPAPDDEMPF